MFRTSVKVDWARLFRQELPRLYNFFRYQVADDMIAEDLTAVTLEKAWESRNRYCQEKGGPSNWIFGIARNVAADHFRGPRYKESLSKFQNQSGDSTSLEDVVQHNCNVERLQSLLMQCSQRERDLIALKYGAGLTNRAIARITELSETNVGTIIHRVIKRLREEWKEE